MFGDFHILVPEMEGRLLSGFIEGECHLGIAEGNGGQSACCILALKVRDDDQRMLEWLVAATGVGVLRRASAQANSAPQLGWHVGRRSECVEIVRFLERFPFMGRKRHEAALWSRAVDIWCRKPAGWLPRMHELKRRLIELRRYRPPRREALHLPSGASLRGFITGFAAAEGCFQLSETAARFTIHLRRDDAPLLEALAASTGVGSVYHPSGNDRVNPSSTWIVRRQSHTQLLAGWLLEADLYGRKRAELEAWAVAVEEICLARATGRKRDPAVMSAARAALASARRYTPRPHGPLEQLYRPSLQERAVAALRQWAAETDGPLSATGYESWRRGVAGSPTRNSVAAALGSWHDALAAVGLEDRAGRGRAHAEAVRAGSRPFAERQRQRQRARVLAGLARYEQEHGTLPGVTDFMRWRLRTGADVPSHVTYYRVFGGGWETVLRAYRKTRAQAAA